MQHISQAFDKRGRRQGEVVGVVWVGGRGKATSANLGAAEADMAERSATCGPRCALHPENIIAGRQGGHRPLAFADDFADILERHLRHANSLSIELVHGEDGTPSIDEGDGCGVMER